MIINNYRFNHPSLNVMVIPKTVTLNGEDISIGKISYYGVYLISSDDYKNTNYFGMTENEFEEKMKAIINSKKPFYLRNLAPRLDGSIRINPYTHRFSCDLWSKGYPSTTYLEADLPYTDFRR